MPSPSIERFNTAFRQYNVPYNYPILHSEVANDVIEQHIERMHRRFAVQTGSWTDERNGEWIIHYYFAMKMILSSSVMLSSLLYCIRKHVKIVIPYLTYYAMFLSGRTLLFTCPDVNWNGGQLVEISHEREFNEVVDFVIHLDAALGNRVKEVFRRARSLRELYSYRFPASGLNVVPEQLQITSDEAVEFCTLMSELAQLNSDILHSSYDRRVTGEFDYGTADMSKVFDYRFERDIGVDSLVDDEDYYRIGYILRKMRRPKNLIDMFTEGQVEDFFGAWRGEEEGEDVYDPETLTNWHIIFPLP